MTRVLLVEDEPDLADPLAYLLRREGYEVEIAEDGAAALASFREFGADIVLLDLMLPGMPGTEVCRQLRASSSVPIIMLTAKDSEVDIVVGLELGADDYVTKPYSARELLARMRAVLRRLSTAEADLDDRILEGHVTPHGNTLRDGTQAGTGDIIITRKNDRRLSTVSGSWVKNGDRWRVTAHHDDGSLTVARADARNATRVLLPAAYVAGSIASRTVLATARINAANRAFNAVTTPSARARLRDALLGRTRSGSVARVAVVAAGAGVVAHVYTEEVPATGRRRLMLLNLGDEERLLRAATAAQFERLDGSFLPPSHPATQRVAGILWKLVNRLDPTLVVGTNPTDENLSTHPLLAEGATWSLHVYDSPEVNASVAPGAAFWHLCQLSSLTPQRAARVTSDRHTAHGDRRDPRTHSAAG